MKSSCTDPPPVKSSNDTLLLSWNWNSRGILGERDCVGPSVPWTEAVLCSAFSRTHLPLPENEFLPSGVETPGSCLAGFLALQPAWNNTTTKRCVNVSIHWNEVLAAKQSFGDLNCLMCIKLWEKFKVNHEYHKYCIFWIISSNKSTGNRKWRQGRMGSDVSHWSYQCF